MTDSNQHSGRIPEALEEARQLCARSDTFRDYPEFKLARALLELEEQLESLRTALTIIKDRDPNELGYIQFVQHIAFEALGGSNPASEDGGASRGASRPQPGSSPSSGGVSSPASRCATCGLPGPEKCWCGEVKQ